MSPAPRQRAPDRRLVRAAPVRPEPAFRMRAGLAQHPRNKAWAFGLKHFREIKHFGFESSEIDRRWLVSVVYRLAELSALSIQDVTRDGSARGGTLRIHEIDWFSRGIPIAPDDLDWMPEPSAADGREFTLIQIAVSKATGRLIGFFDEDDVFQIVLFDPLHNAQPSKFNDYKVRLS